jgi:small GTP-binding protein
MKDTNESNKNAIKIVLIGNSGVGKTCISQKYINENQEIDEEVSSTIGASYFQKFLEIDGKSISLDIWDTAGQERYRSMGKMFYKDAYIVLFVYDITDLKSFEELQKVWYPELTNSGEKHAVMAVVGNKSDLFEKEQVNEEDARKWAKEIGAIFGLVSAKTGDCIKELFENCVKKYLSPDFIAVIKSAKRNKGEGTKIDNNNNNNNNKKKKRFC